MVVSDAQVARVLIACVVRATHQRGLEVLLEDVEAYSDETANTLSQELQTLDEQVKTYSVPWFMSSWPS